MSWYAILIIIHIIGAILGVGAATASDITFLKSLKKGVFSKPGFNFLKKMSSIVWLGLIFSAFSGIGFFIFYRLNFLGPAVSYSPRLWAHLTIALVVFFNGLAMHWKVFPVLESFIDKPFSLDFIKKSKIVFSTGAISIISWYFTFVLGAWHELNLSYLGIMSVYFLLILGGVLIANLIGKRIIHL